MGMLKLEQLVNYAGRVELSTIDWIGNAAYVIFLNWCPMRCPFCHNAQLRTKENWVPFDEITKGILEALPFVNHLVISGGEPAAQPDACRSLIEFGHNIGMGVAVETSGCLPLVEGFDKVMVSIPPSLQRPLYDSYTGFPAGYDNLLSNLRQLDPRSSEVRLIMFPEFQFDIRSMGAVKGLPIRIMIGKGSGHGMSTQEELRGFGFELYEYLGYIRATIETGRMLICP